MNKCIQTIKIVLISAFLFCVTNATAHGVGSANVKFGKPDKSNTMCSGKGICTLTSISTSGDGTIGVSFELLPEIDGSRDLVMIFNINDLRVADREQADLFVNADGTPQTNYNMDYTFTNAELCNELGVATGELRVKSTDANVIEMISSSSVRVTYRITTR